MIVHEFVESEILDYSGLLKDCRFKPFKVQRSLGGFQQPVEPHQHGTYDREKKICLYSYSMS